MPSQASTPVSDVTGAAAEAGDPSRPAPDIAGLRRRLDGRSIVLVGMMGAGKSSVGRRLAARMGLPFTDADAEIEAAAGCTIPEIFELHGEPYFRDGERRVIARLLGEGPQVLATGGGAWMNEETRANIAAAGVSVWLKADLEVLARRVRRRNDRPLIAGPDGEEKMKRLIEERYPVYATADLTVLSREVSHEVVVEEVLAGLTDHLQDADGAP